MVSYSDPKIHVVTGCEECGEEIYEGDDYYLIDGKAYCPDCIRDMKRMATYEG